MQNKTGVLLVNLGTPDSPSTGDVRKYLREFLNDPRVIDIPALSRLLLVNLIIVPFRAPKSAKLYQHIWEKEGSPLLTHGENVKKLLQEALGDQYVVEFGMRYQKPALKTALDSLQKAGVEKIIVFPMYPQYASSSTGSTLEAVMKYVQKWEVIPHLEVISQFYDDPGFINSWIEVAGKYNPEDYEHIVFSFHGLPERQIKKADLSNTCLVNGNCCDAINDKNYYCYRAACFHTARTIAEKLSIPKEKYTVSFQSRLGKTPWIKPYSDHVITEKAKASVKKMLVFSPAFVADCLETLYEIGVEYNDLFKSHGGEKIQLVESLNDHPSWVHAMKSMIEKK